jgi:hypothetical protein
MRLRHGVTAAHAIKVLRELAMSVQTARAAVVAGDGVRYRRDQYLSWADDAENRLRNLFAEQDLVNSLHSERYWRIHNLEDYSARPTALLLAEIDLQLGLLLSTVERLESYRQLAQQPGKILVLDTNTFMHCSLFTEIRWCDEFNVGAVRLVLPLLVLDELDDKTFSAHARLSKRASKVLRTLDPFMDRVVEAGAAEITSSVTLEVLRDDEDHRRRGNNDTELLDRAEFLAQVTERPVTLVTTDYGMRVRSRARNLFVRVMPEQLRLPLDDA